MKKFLITLLTAISSFNPVLAENYLETRGKYLVCPNNNRVVDPLNLPLKASAPFRLKKKAKKPKIKIPENQNPYKLNFGAMSMPNIPDLGQSIFNFPLLVSYDSWIAIAKEDIMDTNTVIKNFLSKDIKPPTSYRIQKHNIWDGTTFNRSGNLVSFPSDEVTFVNSEGTQLTLVFGRGRSNQPDYALDGTGKKFKTQEFYTIDMIYPYDETIGPSRGKVICNSNDTNITYKGAYTFKMRLFDEFGVESMSPLLILNTRFIMKTEPAPQSSGGFQF